MDDRNHDRKITLAKLRRGADEARADAEFWLSLTGGQRVELLWDMVLDELGHEDRAGQRSGQDGTVRSEGGRDDQPRLSRSVRRVRRP